MENLVNILEIKNKSARLLVGYILEDKIKVVYKKKIKLNVPISLGGVLDVGSLTNDLSSLIQINDEEFDFKYTVKDVILLVPSYGLEVYKVTKSTNTTSSTAEINSLDIENVYRLIEREEVPNNNILVNIIPNVFTIEDGEKFLKAPLGYRSRSINLDANVYTLPRKTLDDIKRAVLNAPMNITRTFVGCICISSLLSSLNYKHGDYILVDVDSRNTTLTLVNRKKVCSSTNFTIGGDTLTERIASSCEIDFAQAEKIKIIFGLDSTNNTYNPAIIEGRNASNNVLNKTVINNIVTAYMKDFAGYLNNSINYLLKDNIDIVDRIPIILCGNGTKLNGFKEFLMKEFPSKTIETVDSNVVGAEFDEYGSLLGAIYLKSDLDENFNERVKRNVSSNNEAYLRRVGGNENE